MSKTKRKRDRRKQNKPAGIHGTRLIRPQNKFLQMQLTLKHLQEIINTFFKNGPPDWNNLPWPQNYNHEKYLATRNYCSNKLSKHQEGRNARFLGGPEPTKRFNQLLYKYINEKK